MAESPEQHFVVFFSWQSDLPKETTRYLIWECLREASTELEKNHAAQGLRIVLDEATRGTAGSPNIPQTILEKISRADAVVCDITTINQLRSEGQRAVPNPNVAIELGYAIGQVGWERIIMLFNTAHGSFSDDMPFDVDRQRASPYTFSLPLPAEETLSAKQKAAQLKALKSPLRDLLVEALAAIWRQAPAKPTDLQDLPPEQRKQQRDLATLLRLFSALHLPTVDHFLDVIEIGQIPERTFHFWESFNGLFSSRLFHLYDDRARDLVAQVHELWGGCFEFDRHFRPNSGHNMYIFGGSGDAPLDGDQQQAWNTMQSRAKQMRAALDNLLNHVRANYIEIDLQQTSGTAWREYIAFQEDFERAIDRPVRA